MIDINTLMNDIHWTAINKGFWPDEPDRIPDTYVAKLMMITTEVAEIVEAYRKQQGSDRIEEEFADLLIRIFDLYIAMNDAGLVINNVFDIVEKKAGINKERPHMHGNLI